MWDLWKCGRLVEFVDPLLRNEPPTVEIMRCVQIALVCVEENRADRPAMSDVVTMLSCGDVTLPVPKQPAYYKCKRDVAGTLPTSETASTSTALSWARPESECLAGRAMDTPLSVLLVNSL